MGGGELKVAPIEKGNWLGRPFKISFKKIVGVTGDHWTETRVLETYSKRTPQDLDILELEAEISKAFADGRSFNISKYL